MVKTSTLMLDAPKPKDLGDYIAEGKLHESLTSAKLGVMKEVFYAKKTVPQPGAGITYNYLSEGDLLQVLRPAMVRHGLTMRPVSVTQLASDEWNSKAGSIQHRVRFAVTYEMTCLCADGKTEAELIAVVGEGMDSGDKAAGKAMTAAEKYALRQGFLIESGVDPDKFESQEVVSMAGSIDQEKQEAFLRFQGAVQVAGTLELLDKLRASYTARNLGDKHTAALEELYAQSAARITKGGANAQVAQKPAQA